MADQINFTRLGLVGAGIVKQVGAELFAVGNIDTAEINNFDSEAAAAAPVQSVNGQTDAVLLDTDDVNEASNLYFTNARADNRITLQKGQPNGIADLDATGKVPAAELPIGTSIPSPTGTGASGTWGISISGNAATVTTVPALSGDITTPGSSNVTTLASIVTPGTSTKVTYNAKGLITAGTTLSASDIPTLTASKISDFNTAADARITAQKGVANGGLATLGDFSRLDWTQMAYPSVISFANTGLTITPNYDHFTTILMKNASPSTVTINSSATTYPGQMFEIVQYTSAGQVTITAGSGVTLRSADGALKTRTQYSSVFVIWIGANEWLVRGDTVT